MLPYRTLQWQLRILLSVCEEDAGVGRFKRVSEANLAIARLCGRYSLIKWRKQVYLSNLFDWTEGSLS
jgi:hypothetical protein